jgi:hypothetical protein
MDYMVTTSDAALPDGAIVELYACDHCAGSLIVAAMIRENRKRVAACH